MRRSLRLRCSSRPGVGVFEVLLGLAIAAVLLASLAAAIYAAARSISDNQSYYKASQSGRVAVSRIVKAVRTAQTVHIGDANGSSTSGTALYVYPTPTTVTAFIYDSAGQRLLYDTDPETPSDTPSISNMQSRMSGSDPSVFVLARNVESLTFSCEYQGGTAASVNVNLLMKDGDRATYACNEAIVPRKAIPPATAPAP